MTGDPQTRGVCTGCGLGCDDVTFETGGGGVVVTANGCTRAGDHYARIGTVEERWHPPMINGRQVSRDQALQQAAAVLPDSDWPLITGLATDVAGVRASLRLAEKLGAVVDHMDSQAAFRNLSTMQYAGWVSTTLTEARNRADLFVVFGTEVLQANPRLAERVFDPPQTLHTSGVRSLTVVGPAGIRPDLALPEGLQVDWIDVNLQRIEGIAATLLSQVQNTARPPVLHSDVPAAAVSKLATQLTEARYPVVLWSANEFDFPHSELVIQRTNDLVRALNEEKRCAVLPMVSGRGPVTAQQVCTWTCGFPPRTSFARGYPDFDPWCHDATRLIERGRVDRLVWVTGLVDDPAPQCAIPTVVFGHPATGNAADAEVFVPVGIPGIDHDGQVFRCDNIPLTLGGPGLDRLPSAASAIARVLDLMQ